MADRMSGNKGEWSELYAFLKLLADGRVYAANEKVEKIEDVYYPILKIFREEHRGEPYEYTINGQNIDIISSNHPLKQISRSKISEKADYLLRQIASHSNSFEVEEISRFVNGIQVTKIKAPSTDTTDISMQIEDINTGFKSHVGFSIKSELGNAPTLLNAGETTNFIYKVIGITDDQMNKINSIETQTKILDRMNMIREFGGKISFYDLYNAGFKRNLVMIDSLMPKIVAEMLLYHYQEGKKTCAELVKTLGEKDPIGFGEEVIYSYKIKKFLCSCALGMKPARKWDGIDEANGGYIIVKSDGEVLAYHIYNRNMFEQYLLDNTCLERASTTRHHYMTLYRCGDEMFLNLNLQIRFVR